MLISLQTIYITNLNPYPINSFSNHVDVLKKHYTLYSNSYSYVNGHVMSLPPEVCVFCRGVEEGPVERGKLGLKAYQTLKSTATSARQQLPEGCVQGATYHNACKLRLIRSMESSVKGSDEKRARISFPFRTNCFVCGAQVAKFTNTDLKVII